jgi:hypothetical protein
MLFVDLDEMFYMVFVVVGLSQQVLLSPRAAYVGFVVDLLAMGQDNFPLSVKCQQFFILIN